MDHSQVNTLKKWITVLGSFLILFPVGITWYWGNMSVYVISYARQSLPPNSNVEVPWVLPLFFLGGCTGALLSAFMKHFFGKRTTVIFGTVAFSAGWLGAYFAVQRSLMVMNVVLGLVVSIGVYTLEGIATLYALEWCQAEMGIVCAIVQSGITSGAICINQLVTFYVNPRNLLPDEQIGPSKFFTQADVVDKVPSMYLMVACIGICFNVVGLLLVRDVPDSKKPREHHNDSENTKNGNIESNGQESYTRDDESTFLKEPRQQKETSPSLAATTIGSTDLSPKQVFYTSTLYYYWFFFIVGEVSMITVCNYFKAYGQLYIKDDHFLTDISTALLVVITTCRIFWGLMLDRYGLKATFVLYFAGCGLASPCLYFSALIGKWCFVITTLVFGFLSCPLYVIFTYAAAKSFGKTHFLIHFGLIMIPTTFASVGLPPLLEYVLINLGWFYVFGFCSCCNLVGLFVVIFGFCRTSQ